MLTQCFSFKMIRNKFYDFWIFITVSILKSKDLKTSILYSLSTILYIRDKKNKKSDSRQYVFIDTHDLQKQKFLINLLRHIC